MNARTAEAASLYVSDNMALGIGNVERVSKERAKRKEAAVDSSTRIYMNEWKLRNERHVCQDRTTGN